MKVISFKICPFVQRVTALLAAKNIPYELEYIRLNDKPEWFLALSPNAQVPVLVTDSGVALFESDAIVEYLDEISSPLETHISPEQRAMDRAWSYMATKHYLSQCSTMRSVDEDTLKQRSESLQKIFAKAEANLGKGRFFKGDNLSNVDIAWLPLLHRSAIIFEHTGYDFLTNYPNVQAWQTTLLNTDLVKRSVAEDFEKAFISFYLSDKTCLGQCKKAASLCNAQCC